MLRTVFHFLLLPVPEVMTGIEREVSKMACMISKTTNIAAKILTEINQEIESRSFKNRAIILQFTIDYFLFKHNFGCNNFLACIVLVCQISLLLSMVNSPTGLEK